MVSFLDLPHEIRDMVYHYLVPKATAPALIEVPYDPKESEKSFVALWCVCKQVYAELPPIKQLFRSDAARPWLAISFNASEATLPEGVKIRRGSLREAAVLNVGSARGAGKWASETEATLGMNKETGEECQAVPEVERSSICSRDGWYTWEKNWAKRRWTTEALRIFFEGSRSEDRPSKKIELHDGEDKGNCAFRGPLTFLFLTLEELIDSPIHLGSVQLHDTSGNLQPTPQWNIQRDMAGFHLMFAQHERHEARILMEVNGKMGSAGYLKFSTGDILCVVAQGPGRRGEGTFYMELTGHADKPTASMKLKGLKCMEEVHFLKGFRG